ncbi:unnamed protein product [Coregonus sp. 'balchen']|nr:unnamed protein product [Coregonus sp. 'balchen']
MWPLRLWDAQEVTIFLSLTLYVCHLAGAISIRSLQQSLTRPVQQDVLFSVDISCVGTPTIQWTFMSGRVSRNIGAWQPGGYTNVSEDYMDRVHTYTNGSMGLSDLRIQDAGFYVITVLYEDLQYLSVLAVVLASLAGFLMVSMWLMDKAYCRIKAWRQRRQMPENYVTELQPL